MAFCGNIAPSRGSYSSRRVGPGRLVSGVSNLFSSEIYLDYINVTKSYFKSV